ncbi:MAG: 1-deoxy-D-xylulose-5-phosphate synthase [Succinivibrionaceae bacterium]|nr:1-deoxy-D-xylulose-5-phosphate synthase [Succinivibrionaceae bacterium]
MELDPKQYKLLSKVKLPSDLRNLDISKLPALCEEIRKFLLESVSKSSGHLASGLGVVELTVALHYVYDTPDDQIVWDVGHQAYPHKILTGRAEQLDTIRQLNGLHPFPWREESEFDSASVGHSSTSIGLALGMSIANKIKGLANKVIAVIGDGALTGGMAFEALNHAGGLKSDMLVILNDNEKSISESVGALSSNLSDILSSAFYNNVRDGTYDFLGKYIPFLKDFTQKTAEHIKGMVMPGTLFEEFGFNYIGPIDGHNVIGLIETLQNMKKLKGPQFLHVVTQKGRGYKPAEDDPTSYHGVPKFELNYSLPKSKAKTYAQVFGDFLVKRAEQDPLMVAITPAMKEGSCMNEFAEKYPDRFFDVAIAEQHAVTLAAGMAIDGLHPIVCIYSTFLQRSYDQIIHDVAIQNLPIVFAIDRAGIVGADGPTHQGQFDISFLRIVPNMTIMTPSCFSEMINMLDFACGYKGPVAVRYPRGTELPVVLEVVPIEYGKGSLIRKGENIVFLNFGALLGYVQKAAEKLNATVVDMRFAKPIDEDIILQLADPYNTLFVTVEDGSVIGGAGEGVAALFEKNLINIPLLNLGLPDEFVEQGRPEELYRMLRLDEDGIVSQVQEYMENNNID